MCLAGRKYPECSWLSSPPPPHCPPRSQDFNRDKGGQPEGKRTCNYTGSGRVIQGGVNKQDRKGKRPRSPGVTTQSLVWLHSRAWSLSELQRLAPSHLDIKMPPKIVLIASWQFFTEQGLSPVTFLSVIVQHRENYPQPRSFPILPHIKLKHSFMRLDQLISSKHCNLLVLSPFPWGGLFPRFLVPRLQWQLPLIEFWMVAGHEL